MEQLTKNVFVDTQTRGAHHGAIVTSQGVVLIDSPVDQDDARAWAKETSKLGKLLYIINTEFHFDHCMNNHFFGCPAIASEITSDIIKEANNDAWLKARTKQLYAHHPEVPSPDDYRRGWPSITFSDALTIGLGEHTLQIMLLAGHTPGQTAVYIPEEKVLFASDNMSKYRGAALHDAVPDKWLASLEFYKILDLKYIVTGHTGIIDKDFNQYIDQQAAAIKERVAAVKQAKADRLTVDEACERIAKLFVGGTPMPASQDFAPAAGIGGIRRWVAHIYQVTGANVTETPR